MAKDRFISSILSGGSGYLVDDSVDSYTRRRRRNQKPIDLDSLAQSVIDNERIHWKDKKSKSGGDVASALNKRYGGPNAKRR